jgi:hypothetical protein
MLLYALKEMIYYMVFISLNVQDYEKCPPGGATDLRTIIIS